MKFNVDALREATNAAIVQHRADYDTQQSWMDEQDRLAGERWVQEHGERWAAFAKLVSSRSRKGKPINRQDAPDYQNYKRSLFSPPYGPTREPYRMPRELQILAGILPSIMDTEVTSAGLKELGITAATLRQAALHMPSGTVSA